MRSLRPPPVWRRAGQPIDCFSAVATFGPEPANISQPRTIRQAAPRIDEYLSKFQGIIADTRSDEDGPVVEGVRLTREQATEQLNRMDAEMREQQQAREGSGPTGIQLRLGVSEHEPCLTGAGAA